MCVKGVSFAQFTELSWMGVLKNKSFRSDSADLTGLSDLAGWISLLDSCGIDSFLWPVLFTVNYKD
jgi:hypothetical protein